MAKPVTFEQFIKKEFGDGTITSAAEIIDRPREVIPTTISLDIALNGGIPEGRWP